RAFSATTRSFMRWSSGQRSCISSPSLAGCCRAEHATEDGGFDDVDFCPYILVPSTIGGGGEGRGVFSRPAGSRSAEIALVPPRDVRNGRRRRWRLRVEPGSEEIPLSWRAYPYGVAGSQAHRSRPRSQKALLGVPRSRSDASCLLLEDLER